MKKAFERIKNYRLMVKIFLVMVLSIITITIATTFSTYHMSKNLFIETFSITNSKILKQITNGVEDFNFAVVNTANNLEQSQTVKNYLTEKDASSLEMTKSYYDMGVQMERTRQNIDAYDTGITIIGINGRSFSSNRTYWPISDADLKNHPITEISLRNPQKLTYHYDDLKIEDSAKPAIIASRALMDRKNGEIYGVMYIAMQEDEFQQFYSSYTSEGNDVLAINGDGVIVSSNRKELIGQAEPELLSYATEIEEDHLNYKSVKFADRKNIVLAEYLPSLDLYIVNLIDRNIVVDNIINKKSIALIIVLIIAIAAFFIYIFSKRLTSSLTDLVYQINSISEHDFNQYIDASGSYETKQVANAFNIMLDELQDYVEKLMITQKKQRHAELTALQQQINPHFLYNTLASIKIIAKQGDIEKATNMINKLISLLQNTIGNMSEMNTVEQEINNMKDYVYINQVRYGSQIRVNYFVTPDSLSYQLPKLIIQPFIENAFFHAFNQKTSGFIHIMVGVENNELVCEIVDNGDGMEIDSNENLPIRNEKTQLYSGIGVKNVNDRIKLMYGEFYGVEISSVLGEGTRIRIRLPIIKGENL